MLSIEKFCARNNACEEGREWALANCTDMQDVWNKLDDDEWFLWVACQPGVLSDKELQLFAVYCMGQVKHILIDPRLQEVIKTAESFIGGEAKLTDLLANSFANSPAFLEVFLEEKTPEFYAYKAACSLVQITLPKNRYKSKDAGEIAWSSAWAVAREAESREAESQNFRKRKKPLRAREKAMAANLKGKVKWLRENTKPNFEE